MDDLHWDENDKKFVALSEEEMETILMVSAKSGLDMDDEEVVMGVIRWAEHVRVGNILLRRVLDGSLAIGYVPGMEEPCFTKAEEE